MLPIKYELEKTVSKQHCCCSSRRLCLNPVKTEDGWFSSSSNHAKLLNHDTTLHLNTVTITPVDSVRVLGVQLDCEVNMRAHIGKIAASCFFHLRRLRQLRHIVNQDVMKRLVCTYILARLDYCNCVLAELPAKSLKPLERVMNAATNSPWACNRAILAILNPSMQPHDHITEAMHNLHWLPLTLRIKYKSV